MLSLMEKMVFLMQGKMPPVKIYLLGKMPIANFVSVKKCLIRNKQYERSLLPMNANIILYERHFTSGHFSLICFFPHQLDLES